MSLDFYDRAGNARIYTDDGKHLFSWAGQPVAYFHGDHVYLFNGMHFGRLKNGWIIDDQGRRVLFSAGATGGPQKPLRRLKPLKGLRQLKPLKGQRQLSPLPPLTSNSWTTCPW